MKNFIKLILVSCIALSSIQGVSAKDKVKGSDKDTVTFQVAMKCHKCQAKIEDNISFEKGVADLSVNLETKTVTVVYKKKKTDIDKLKDAFKKLGYDVVVIEK